MALSLRNLIDDSIHNTISLDKEGNQKCSMELRDFLEILGTKIPIRVFVDGEPIKPVYEGKKKNMISKEYGYSDIKSFTIDSFLKYPPVVNIVLYKANNSIHD